jgi:hypothetical protein
LKEENGFEKLVRKNKFPDAVREIATIAED